MSVRRSENPSEGGGVVCHRTVRDCVELLLSRQQFVNVVHGGELSVVELGVLEQLLFPFWQTSKIILEVIVWRVVTICALWGAIREIFNCELVFGDMRRWLDRDRCCEIVVDPIRRLAWILVGSRG